ncbi:MAG: winged helix-turn-helix transcriptional regulator [Polyangiaceae bacterium]|nr:winged helix-turn-helix transcriptional regulator [Polyangiaceae bacterium]
MFNEQTLDRCFAALADPTRRAILRRLSKGEATVSELAKPFGLRQPSISKHLRILEEAGFISQSREAQRRPRHLVIGGPLEGIDQWLSPFREQWEQRFDNLDAFLTRPKANRTKQGKKHQ